MKKFDKRNIIMELDSKTKETAIKALSDVFYTNGYIDNTEEFLKSVIEREMQISTGIGGGIAIPHGKSAAVLKSGIVVAKTSNPIEWESHDGAPVQLIFMLAIEDVDKANEHLRMLAEISEKVMDDDFVEDIMKSNDKDYVYKILGGE